MIILDKIHFLISGVDITEEEFVYTGEKKNTVTEAFNSLTDDQRESVSEILLLAEPEKGQRLVLRALDELLALPEEESVTGKPVEAVNALTEKIKKIAQENSMSPAKPSEPRL